VTAAPARHSPREDNSGRPATPRCAMTLGMVSAEHVRGDGRGAEQGTADGKRVGRGLHHANSGQGDAHGRRGRLLRPIALNRCSPSTPERIDGLGGAVPSIDRDFACHGG
jgi:hypothetical protein